MHRDAPKQDGELLPVIFQDPIEDPYYNPRTLELRLAEGLTPRMQEPSERTEVTQACVQQAHRG